jgi:hypothetical protein
MEAKCYKIPVTYSDWLNCFEQLKTGTRIEFEFFTHLYQGRVPCDLTMQKSFEEQLIATINIMLNNRIRKFNKELNFLLNCNETYEVFLTFERLNKSFDECLFFNELRNLNKTFMSELHQSIEKEIYRFWDLAVIQLHKQSIQVGNLELEAIMLEVKKIRLLSTHLKRSDYGRL